MKNNHHRLQVTISGVLYMIADASSPLIDADGERCRSLIDHSTGPCAPIIWLDPTLPERDRETIIALAVAQACAERAELDARKRPPKPEPVGAGDDDDDEDWEREGEEWKEAGKVKRPPLRLPPGERVSDSDFTAAVWRAMAPVGWPMPPLPPGAQFVTGGPVDCPPHILIPEGKHGSRPLCPHCGRKCGNVPGLWAHLRAKHGWKNTPNGLKPTTISTNSEGKLGDQRRAA